MKLSPELEHKLKSLAKGDTKDFLIEYFEYVKTEVADVRNPLNVSNQIQTPVRIGICNIIDEFLIQRLKVLDSPKEEIKDNWN